MRLPPLIPTSPPQMPGVRVSSGGQDPIIAARHRLDAATTAGQPTQRTSNDCTM